MGAATGRDLHIDVTLSNMAMGYRPEGFIADMIFPTVLVPKQSDLYNIFDRGDRLRVEDTTRAPGTWFGLDGSLSSAVNAVTWEVSSPMIPTRKGASWAPAATALTNISAASISALLISFLQK